MDFTYTEEQEMVRELAATFAKNYVAPLSEQMDIDNTMPHHIAEKMAELGFMGINVPEEYGGAGMDEVSKALVIMEIAKVDASVAELLAVHTLTNDIFLKRGTEEQKKKYLALGASGKVGAFALTEPGAGSDASAAKTKAISDGDDYIINGTKCFISNMGPEEGDYVVLIALTDPSAGTKGMSAIVVDRNTPGFSVGKLENKMGLRGANVSELIFQDCRVPKSNLLGKEGEGFKIAMAALDGGRIGIAAQSVGLAQGALDEAIAYCKERKQFGKPITAFQNTQFRIAELQARIDAARLLTWRAAVAKDNGEPYNVYAAEAKLVASDVANDVCRAAVQFMGGYGYCREYGVERKLRDVKITEIYEGTSEVMKMVISGSLLR